MSPGCRKSGSANGSPSGILRSDLNIPEGLPLADPDFRQPGPIDLTLGVEVFSRVIKGELLELKPN